VNTENQTPQVSYDLPGWEHWQAGDETRSRLGATAYIRGAVPVGRGVFVTGSVAFLERDGEWGWGVGDYLYRCDEHGKNSWDYPLEPTGAMRKTARGFCALYLQPPSDELRLRVLLDSAARRNEHALEEYRRTVADTAALARRALDSIRLVHPSDFLEDGAVVPRGTGRRGEWRRVLEGATKTARDSWEVSE